MSGIFLAVIRLAEPYVFQQLRASFCKNTKQEKCKFCKEALCSFVNSAMNIEFVYIILLGINNFMDSVDSDEKSRPTNI